MMNEKSRDLLNMEDLNQAVGGVTYEYEQYRVVFPGDEEDPNHPNIRVINAAYIAICKKAGETLEQALGKYDILYPEFIRFYWDKVILK